MKKFIIIGIVFFISLLMVSVCLAASGAREIKRANQLYHDKEYKEAQEKYNKVLEDMPDSVIANFGLGAALYKNVEYEKAMESFTKSMTTDDVSLEAKANYNAGNCKYKQGKLEADIERESAISLYREALDYYKRAIELAPEDEDAKYNHEFVERELELLLDKAKQGEKKQSQEKDKQEDKKEGKKEKQEKEAKGEKEDKGKDKQESEPSQGPGEPEREKVRAGTEQEEQDMSQGEARMLLEGYRQEEESKGKVKMKPLSSDYSDVLKDW